jgi:hypothetical protein
MDTTITDAEYHLSFGLHSGIPLCCSAHFALDGGRGGPCPKCLEKGHTLSGWNLHTCGDNPACQPYLDRVDLNHLKILQRWLDGSGVRVGPPKVNNQDDNTWGSSTTRPLSDACRELLKENGFLMVHICWPEECPYVYIFQRNDAKPGKCDFCKKKYSLKFPTTGKQAL